MAPNGRRRTARAGEKGGSSPTPDPVLASLPKLGRATPLGTASQAGPTSSSSSTGSSSGAHRRSRRIARISRAAQAADARAKAKAERKRTRDEQRARRLAGARQHGGKVVMQACDPPVFGEMAKPLRVPAKAFLDRGMCTPGVGLTRPQVMKCRQEVYRMFNQTMRVVKRLGLQEELASTGFSRFKLRHSGRYDMQIDVFDDPGYEFLRREAPWMPLVHAILGADCVLGNAGVMLSLPGSVTQPWHSDGDHLYKTHQLPYCLNVFVPLVTITPLNGGTELVPTTHLHGNYEGEGLAPATPLLRAGECMLFDFRLRHRGLGNKSLHPRPVMYLTYRIPYFEDTMNFSKRRYLSLPDLPKDPSRKQRAAKRSGEADSDDMDVESEEEDMIRDYDSETERVMLPKKEGLSEVARVRAARKKHRERALTTPRTKKGIALYRGSPLLAKDRGCWYPASIAKLDEAKGEMVVHFTGWPKRHDFRCAFSDPRIKAGTAGLNAQWIHNHDKGAVTSRSRMRRD